MKRVFKVSMLAMLAVTIALIVVVLMRPGARTGGVPSHAAPAENLDESIAHYDGNPQFVPQIEFWGDVPEDGFQIGVGLAKGDLHYEVGEPVDILLSTRNRSSTPREMPHQRSYDQYWVSVVDSSGRKVQLTKAGQILEKNRGRAVSYLLGSLPPGQELKQDMVISLLFDMSAPGRYTITVISGLSKSASKGLGHQITPITIDVGATSSDQEIANLDAEKALHVDWKADDKTLTLSRQTTELQTQGSVPADGAAKVTVFCSQTPTGQLPQVPQRVVSVVKAFLEHTNDKPPADYIPAGDRRW